MALSIKMTSNELVINGRPVLVDDSQSKRVQKDLGMMIKTKLMKGGK